jgi:hypothetical protein
MAKATKEQIEHAKKLASQGFKAKEVSEKSGVCIQTAYYLCSQIKEPRVTTRPMNAEEIKKYGEPKTLTIHKTTEVTKPAEKTKDKPEKVETSNSEVNCPRQIEIKSGPIEVGMAAREVEFTVRSLRYLKVKHVEIIIRSAEE